MKKFTIIAVLFTLTSCAGGASQYQLNSAMQKADQAAANCPMQAMSPEVKVGWEKAENISRQTCPDSSKISNPTPEQLKESYACWENTVIENVKPVTKQTKALESYLAKGRKISKDRQAGTITRDTAMSLMGQHWQDYVQKEISYYQMAQCQNAAFQQYVMPVYHNKAVLADFMVKRSEIAMKVDQGKLTRQQADLETQKAFAGFVASEQNANAAIQAQNAQAWREYSAGMRQVSQQLNQQQAIKAQQCGSIDIPPMASIGCKNICINGSWAEVCG